MSAEGLRRVVIEMIANPEFAKRVIKNPKEELKNSGFDLKDLDIDIVAKLDPEKLQIKILEPSTDLGYVDINHVTVYP
jgi:hypothetical protein